MTRSRSFNDVLAVVTVALTVLGLFVGGMQFLTVPRIFLLVHGAYPFFPYEGPILIALAIVLAWFRVGAERLLSRAFARLHHALSVLCVAGVVSIEIFLHLIGIAHLEGWWLPLLGSSATAAAMTAWFQKWKKKPPAAPL